MARMPQPSAYLSGLKVAIDQLVGAGLNSAHKHGNTLWDSLQP